MNTQPPRKSLIAVGVAYALLAAALLAGHTASPTRPDGADGSRSSPAQLQSNPAPVGHAPLAMKAANLVMDAAGKTQAD